MWRIIIIMSIAMVALAGCGGGVTTNPQVSQDGVVILTATPFPTLVFEERVQFTAGFIENPFRLAIRPDTTIPTRIIAILEALTLSDDPLTLTTPLVGLEISDIAPIQAAFMADFGKKFYGFDMLSQPVSKPLLNWNLGLCLMSSAKATVDCVRSFSETDLREDVEKINIPVLIIHGDADETVPIELSGHKTSELLPHATYLIYEGAPHGLFVTDKEKLNADLLKFINQGGSVFQSANQKIISSHSEY